MPTNKFEKPSRVFTARIRQIYVAVSLTTKNHAKLILYIHRQSNR